MQAVAAMFKMLELRRSLMAIESMRNAIEEAKTSADSQNWKLDQSKMKLLPGIEQRNKHLTLEFMNSEMEKYGICTEAQKIHFLTQVMHESSNLTRMNELAPKNTNDLVEYFSNKYGHRKDLGCQKPIDDNN